MKPGNQAVRAGKIPLFVFLAHSVCLAAPPLPAAASDGPSWWRNPSITMGGNIPIVTGLPNDYAAVNAGQAKNLAFNAIGQINADLAGLGGAGPALGDLAASLSATDARTNDYAAVDIGQLKALARPFYDRLLSIGYTGPPLTSGTYPWIASRSRANDYAMANIGQVKYLFSFDLKYSSDGNPLPDWWRKYYFKTLKVDPNGTVFLSGSHITFLEAWQQHRNPFAPPPPATLQIPGSPLPDNPDDGRMH